MAVAVFLGRQQDAVFKADKVIRQIDPSVLRLGHWRRDLPRGAVRLVIADFGLVAVDGLKPQAVRDPVDAGQVGVRPDTGKACVLAAFQVVDEEVHKRIRRPGTRIALVDDGGFLGGDIEALDHIYRAFIDLREGNVALIRAPPVAGVAAHFFLRHEFGDAIGDRLVRLCIRRDLAFLASCKVDHEDGAIAHEAHIMALGGDTGVIFEGFGLGQLAGLRAVTGEGDEVKVAAKGNEDRVRRAPVIVDNPLAPGDALSLAQRLFLFRQLDLFGLQQGRIDQHRLLARLHIELPEIVAAGILLARLQEGDALAIGRILHARWRRSVQRG